MNDITIITAVMNRTETALEAFQNWIDSQVSSEIIAVDWSSSIPLKNVWKDKRVRIITVKSEGYWDLCKSFNFAMKFATNEKILKMDIDYRITENIIPHLFSDPDGYYVSSIASRRENRGIDGFIAFLKTQFNEVNGYDERMSGWGWDDHDFFDRLAKNGFKKHELDLTKGSFLFHKQHSLGLRSINCENKNARETTNRNRFLSRGTWSKSNNQSSYIRVEEDVYKREIIKEEKGIK